MRCYKKKMYSVLLLVCFFCVLIWQAQVEFVDCTFYLGMGESGENVSLWNINHGQVYKYVTREPGYFPFLLKEEAINDIEHFQISLESNTGKIIIRGFTVTKQDANMDLYPLDILENIEIEGAKNVEIREDGLLYIEMNGNICNLTLKESLCDEINDFRQET